MTCERFTSLPAVAEGCLPISSSGTSQLPLLNGMPTPAPCSGSAPPTVGSPACACMSATLGCSIHPNTPAAWIASQRDSLAKILATLETGGGLVKTCAADSTAKFCESLAWYDRNSCSWKTSQRSLVTDWEPYSETWPRSGMTRSGVAYVLPMLARRIDGIGGGASPQWPTPRANDAEKRGDFDATNPRNGLPGAVKLWPTPRSSDGTHGGRVTPRKIREGGNLIEAVSARSFPTPCASMHKGSSPRALTRRNGKDRSQDRLDHAVMASHGGQLNPTFVEWLMGVPLGWTALKDWATRKSRSKQPPRG